MAQVGMQIWRRKGEEKRSQKSIHEEFLVGLVFGAEQSLNCIYLKFRKEKNDHKALALL